MDNVNRKRNISNLTPSQYERANRISFIVASITIAATIVMIISKAIVEHDIAAVPIVSITAVIGFIMAALGGSRYHSVRLGSVLIMGGTTLLYIVLILVEDDPVYYMVGMPIMMSCLLYADIRLTWDGNLVLIITLIFTCIRSYVTGSDAFDAEHVGIFVVMGFAVLLASFETVRLRNEFEIENHASIKEGADKAVATGKEMADVANNISKLYEQANEDLKKLEEIINSNKDGMSQIASSMESTTESIIDQAAKCEEIQKQTDQAEELRGTMVDASGKASDVIREGQTNVDHLFQLSKNVQTSSSVVVDSTQAVLDKISDVKGIIGNILSISQRTNLLALNASIEAARAGEAGKGFAVVADEIRDLSEQTNNATNQITDIIKELTDDTDQVMNAVKQSVDSINSQNEMINTVGTQFTDIQSNVDALIGQVNSVGDSMHSIVTSTDEISKNITNLSAASQEISSLSNEGLTTSNQAVDQFQKVQGELDSLTEQAERLQKM